MKRGKRPQCPHCHHYHTYIKGKIMRADYVRETWECAECGERWHYYEDEQSEGIVYTHEKKDPSSLLQ